MALFRDAKSKAIQEVAQQVAEKAGVNWAEEGQKRAAYLNSAWSELWQACDPEEKAYFEEEAQTARAAIEESELNDVKAMYE